MSERRVFYGWVVLAAGATVIAVGMGALFSLSVFLKPIEETMRWSRTGISTIALLNWIAMGLGSFVWGWLSDRIGTRTVVLAGGFILGLGLVLSSRVTELWHLHVTFGCLVGFAVGAFYAPLTSTATKWFVTNRGLAVALVSAGIGFGILIIAPLVRWLVGLFDWRIAMLILGDLAWLIILPVGLLIREQPDQVTDAADREPAHARAYSTGDVMRAPQFWAIALTHFACCAAHSGPIFHMVTNAIDHGVAAMAAATLLSVSGVSSVAGRIVTGLVADRVGAKRTLVAGLALQAALVFLYLFARDARSFYLLGAVFGLAYGGVMPLYALVTHEYFGEKIMGTAYGGVFLISTLGMGIGSFAGGLLFDRLGSYAWLFVTSAAIGVGAVLIALTFRPPRPVAVLAPALQ
jgi:predicted MFS family arabinose efflux permease